MISRKGRNLSMSLAQVLDFTVEDTDRTGQTREKQKTSKPPLQELNHFVSHTIKLDLGNSQMVKTRNVFSVVKRQRGGLCSEGVSSFSLL